MTVRPAFMLINGDPQLSRGARERLELALTLAASDWPLTLAFVDAGVWQLLPPIQGAPLKDFAAAWASLELFGVEQVLVDEVSLARAEIDPARLRVPAAVVSRAELAQHLARAELVL